LSNVTSITLGFDYQYRHFWTEAARLLHDPRLVSRVCIEYPEHRAWDDVVTFYERAIPDQRNRGITAEHFQLKYRTDGRSAIGFADLTDPEFVGAKDNSLLSRLVEAVGEGDAPKQFTLVTPWAIGQSDPLRKLVPGGGQGRILTDRLFEGGPRSEMGRVRERWRVELGLGSADHLRPALDRLVINAPVGSHTVEIALESALVRAGLVPVDRSTATHRYADLAAAFVRTGDTDFDAAHLREVCEREQLLATAPAADPGETQLAITAFARYAAHPEDDANRLDLVPLFEGRPLVAGLTWDGDVVPRIAEFLHARVATGGRYGVHLDCHVSVAYTAGWLLAKSDADVAPVQVFNGQRSVWRPSQDDPGEWDLAEVKVGAGCDVALALSVTHAVLTDVKDYCGAHLPEVGRILALAPTGGPSPKAVRDANHARGLAVAAVREVRSARTALERGGRLHLFAAAPNALAFFMGRVGRVLGQTTIYEYDFDSMGVGAYSPGVSLPPGAER
jgi:hypothetical protein